MTTIDPTDPKARTLTASITLERTISESALEAAVAAGKLPTPPDRTAQPPEGYEVAGRIGLRTKVLRRNGRVWAWPYQDPTTDPGWDEAAFAATYPFIPLA